jgi:hypothetical protein
MSAHGADTQLLASHSDARRSRVLFALLAATFLVKAFWSLELLLVAELIQNLAASMALAMFAADFQRAPSGSLPFRLVWTAVIVTVVATAADILLTLQRLV